MALRRSHTEGVKSFKADMQKKLLEFRKKASRVDEALQNKMETNNNSIFGELFIFCCNFSSANRLFGSQPKISLKF